MPMQRRIFLTANAGGAATLGGAALLGTWQANAASVGPLRAAPTTRFAVGLRQYNWTRGSRPLTTFVHYPATDNPAAVP